ncbi:hypothetical protein SDC9_74087 [bioreactor metagenome]|uniref:Uncharacterized protein n=1 Tax=bioreactor metagenome TaxID=1076179 RepID=A0A644YNB0_9ZZZZ
MAPGLADRPEAGQRRTDRRARRPGYGRLPTRLDAQRSGARKPVQMNQLGSDGSPHGDVLGGHVGS